MLAALGGFIGLDGTSFPQAMFSRPLVASALTGVLLGSPIEGVLVGAFLEVFDVGILPIGAARYPEGGPAAVAASAAYVMATPPGADVIVPGMLLMAVVFGLAWERVGGASVVLSRHINEALLTRHTSGPADRMVEGRQTLAILLDFLRGAFVTAVGAATGIAVLSTLGPFWSIGATATLGVLVVMSVLVLAGALNVFGGWTERKNIFLVGVICGLLALLVLRP
jgi:PTS system mannose-specific IIC component/fructoselysine and glucoselysine-specific PTS system IIC component